MFSTSLSTCIPAKQDRRVHNDVGDVHGCFVLLFYYKWPRVGYRILQT